MFLVITVILLASQAFPGSLAGGLFGKNIAKGDDLDALCSGKPIDLTSIDELQTLVQNLEDLSAPACSDLREPLLDLHALVVLNEDDVCTMEKVDQFKEFYNQYLDTSDDDTKRSSKAKIPKSLAQFALAYGMQLSSHCKLHMMKVLMEKSTHPLNIWDFRELDHWTADGGAIGNMLAALAKPGEIILPGDILAIMPESQLVEKLRVQTPESYKIERAQEVCSKRFKPIYEPVVGPVAALSRAGFDLPDKLWNVRKLETLEVVNEGMNKWSRVVFLCESLALMETTMDESQLDEAEATAAAAFKIGLTPVEEVHSEAEKSGSLGLVVINEYDNKLRQLISSFNTNQVESQRMTARLVERGSRLMKARLRRGEYGAFIKSALDKFALKLSPSAARRDALMNKEISDALEEKEETKAAKKFDRAARPIRQYAQSIVAAMTISDIAHAVPNLSVAELKKELARDGTQ